MSRFQVPQMAIFMVPMPAVIAAEWHAPMPKCFEHTLDLTENTLSKQLLRVCRVEQIVHAECVCQLAMVDNVHGSSYTRAVTVLYNNIT